MRLIFGVCVTLMACIAHAGNKDVDCSILKVDTKWGAEMARGGVKAQDLNEKIAEQGIYLDGQLKKSGRRPMTLSDKVQMKMTVIDGYERALKEPDTTVDRIAAQALLNCTFAKYK